MFVTVGGILTGMGYGIDATVKLAEDGKHGYPCAEPCLFYMGFQNIRVQGSRLIARRWKCFRSASRCVYWSSRNYRWSRATQIVTVSLCQRKIPTFNDDVDNAGNGGCHDRTACNV
eukprot:3444996-Amphidinium_carterae.1